TLSLSLERMPGTTSGDIPTGERTTSLMGTQALPWPGKRGLREAIARQEVAGAEAALERARLGVVAEVKRAYLGLLWVRERETQLADQADLAERAEHLARIRYETGQGAQTDLLRAQG